MLEVDSSLHWLSIGQVEAQSNVLMKETQEYTSRCIAEAKKMAEDIEAEAHKLGIVEREAEEFLRVWLVLPFSFLWQLKGIYKANVYFNNPSGSGIFIFLDENIGFITFWSTVFFLFFF